MFAQIDIALLSLSYTVTQYIVKFRFALAYCNSVYIRKTSQVSLSVTLDAFVLLVLHTFKIATVSYTVISTSEGKFDSPSHAVRPFIMQVFFRFKNGPFLPLLFVTSFLNFLVRVHSYARPLSLIHI